MADAYAVPEARRPSDLNLVDPIRAEVDAWRNEARYDGATATSKRLLRHWFLDEHQRPDGTPFAFYFCQREAIETIVYLHEVVNVRSGRDLIARYARQPAVPLDLPYPRYVVKMATGSGKTKVIALAIAWAYFSSLYEENSRLSPTSLVVAPNLIVYERLKSDFEDGRIFRDDPIVPPEWSPDFDLQVVLRDEPAPMTATGVLALTNVHVLYERRPPPITNPVEALLGPRPPVSLTAAPPLLERLAERGSVLAVNDEAHHLHDQVQADTGDPLVAIQSLRKLNERADPGIVAQLDVSATPRNQDGSPFAEIVVDYPLSQAIDDRIVKRPTIGELHGATEAASTDASVRYRQQLGAGVAKWREFRDRLSPAGHKPLLFVMGESTAAADQIAAWLETLPDLAGRVLTIHVNVSGRHAGEIRRDDLALAREAARQVDSDENPYAAIVSVLMLREGWDVRNVCVIVPLRPYTASSRILPEQTLGRGLRRMMPPGLGVDERVVVIEHEAFRSLWEEYVQNEGVDVDIVDAETVTPTAEVITVEAERLAYEIELPQIARRLTRVASASAALRVEDVPARHLAIPDETPDHLIEYTGRDLRSGEIVERSAYPLARADDPGAVLAWYTNELQRRCRLTGQFAVLAPVVRGYIETRAFERPAPLDEPGVLYALAQPATQEMILETLRGAVDTATLFGEAGEPAAELKPRLLSATRPFLWSGELASAVKSVFNRQPCDSGFEVQFTGFLDRCADIAAFAKLAPAVRFSMEYRTDEGGLAFYYPDFALRDVEGDHYLVETKGLVDVTVRAKDRRASQWCLDATMLTGVRWAYIRVDQELFDAHSPSLAVFRDLYETVLARRRAARLQELPGGRQRSREELLDVMDRTATRTRGNPPDVDAELDRQRDRDG